MANTDTLVKFVPGDAILLGGTHDAKAGRRNGFPTLDFSDVATGAAIFQGVMDSRKAGANYSVTIAWVAKEAIAGDVIWDAAVARGVDDAAGFNIDADSFAAAIAGTADTTSTTLGRLTHTVIALSNAQFDAVAAGELFQLRIRRTPTAAGDTMVGDAQVIGVWVKDVT